MFSDINVSILDILFACAAVVSVFMAFGFRSKHGVEPSKPLVETPNLRESTFYAPVAPQITVVFQKDISNDEELCKEIADMYISNRAFYYSGKDTRNDVVSTQEAEPVLVKYESVDFSSLERVNV